MQYGLSSIAEPLSPDELKTVDIFRIFLRRVVAFFAYRLFLSVPPFVPTSFSSCLFLCPSCP